MCVEWVSSSNYDRQQFNNKIDVLTLHYEQAINAHTLYGSNAVGVDSCLTSAYSTLHTCCK